ncbi:hypothetical protein EON67_08490 [archaeon]|nr:MAG: hypothetical protein EON67_08490 [archaeon]
MRRSAGKRTSSVRARAPHALSLQRLVMCVCARARALLGCSGVKTSRLLVIVLRPPSPVALALQHGMDRCR